MPKSQPPSKDREALQLPLEDESPEDPANEPFDGDDWDDDFYDRDGNDGSYSNA